MDEQDLLIAELREELERVRNERDEFREDVWLLRTEIKELRLDLELAQMKLEWSDYHYD